MAEGYKSYRIRTKVGQDAPNVVNVHLDQTYDEFQILSLKIDQKNSYNLYQSDKGIIVGRVLANGGVGVSNAKVSIFIETDDTMSLDKHIIYPYSSVNDINDDRVRYNLLPDYVDETCHQNVGTFPNKRYVLDNDDVIEVFDRFWKYTTVTNTAGDYMLYGIPTGNHTLHMDVDLSDIGLLSQKPRDLAYKGFNINLFESPTKFKQDTNLNSLAQIKSQDIGVFVYPFWGDSTDNPDNIAVTRCDIQIDYKFEPTCVFIGCIITDTGSNAIGKNCAGTTDVGKMSDLVSGEGSIEMIRKTIDNKVEEFQIKGNRVIDGDGVWCYQIPMNLDYVMTDEFGNLVPTDNPDKGIPTRTRVRFRVSLDDPPSDNTARKRCKYLVPNNPRLDEERFPVFTADKMHEPDYEFGSNTREESFCDLFWNKVYTVKNYIPRIQKNTKITNRKHTGIKLINHYGDNNPMPYNNLSIKLSFTYRFICVLTKIFILLVGFLNNIITILGAIPCKIADFFRSIADFFNFKILGWRPLGAVARMFEAVAKVFDLLTPPCIAISSEFCTGDVTHAYTFYPGCGRKGLANVVGALADCVWERTQERHYDDMRDVKQEDKTEPINNDSELYNCVESQLAEDNDATSFNFQNDWINGTLYSPLWYRKITPKRSFLFGLFKRSAKDEWCSADHAYNGLVRIFHPCAVKRDGPATYTTHDGKSEQARYMSGNPGCSDDCHENKTVIGLNNGVIRTKQTMLGQTVYYYKPVEFETIKQEGDGLRTEGNNNGALKLLFATDIVLLGSLNDCDLNGVPQFFKSLESSTYKLPPNMLFTDNNMVQSFNEDGTISTRFDQVSTSEMTGNDWGNSNDDICGEPDGGLFYDIGCSSIEMIPKSCINLLRICEFGVSLDETKQVPNLANVEESGDNAFETLVPDGFISKDELYNDNERSMFATMNGNELLTKLNTENGLKEYDFRHLYVDNFDNSLFAAMSLRQKKCSEYTYTNNWNLESFSAGYYDFRMGKRPYFYDKENRFPRYENSFYFYFGLKVGKTAIDKFNSQFFAECYNSEDAVSPIRVEVKGNSWCSEIKDDEGLNAKNDGFVKIDLSDISLPCDILIQDVNNGDFEFVVNDINDEKIIIANTVPQECIDTHKKVCMTKDGKTICSLDNSKYTMTVTDSEGEIITVDFELFAPYLKYDVEQTNFKKPENILLDMFKNETNVRDAIARNDANAGVTGFENTRGIGGTIAIYNIVDGLSGDYLLSYDIDIVSINKIDGLKNENDEDIKYEVKVEVRNGGIIPSSASNYLVYSDLNKKLFIFGVPKGDERYKITITQYCAWKDGTTTTYYSTNNKYSHTVYIGDMTPYKLYIGNVVDYDVISHWGTGYELDNSITSRPIFNKYRVNLSGSGTYFDKTKFNENWLHISDYDGTGADGKPRYYWDRLDSYQKCLKKINNDLKNGNSNESNFPFRTADDIRQCIRTENVKTNDNIPYLDGILLNRDLNNFIRQLTNDIDTLKNNSTGSIDIEQEDAINLMEDIIQMCEKIMEIKEEFITQMKTCFWLTCPEESKTIRFRATTDDMPVGFYIAHRSERSADDGNYNVFEYNEKGQLYFSFNEERRITDITIPSLTIRSSENFGIDSISFRNESDRQKYIVKDEVSLGLDNKCGFDLSNRQKYAFFVGVMNSAEQVRKNPNNRNDDEMVPNGDSIPTGIKGNDWFTPQTKKLFGFHVLDKIMNVNYISWAYIDGIPYFKPKILKNGNLVEDTTKNGRSVISNGFFAANMYNGVAKSVDDKTLTEFETKNVGRYGMEIVTPRNVGGRVNNEDSMPTERYISGSTNAPMVYFNWRNYTIDNIFESTASEGGKTAQYVPLLPVSSSMEIEDSSYCNVSEEIYGGMTITLSDDSVNNCKDRSQNVIHVTANNSSGDVVYFVFGVSDTQPYPLNAFNLPTTPTGDTKYDEENDGWFNTMTKEIKKGHVFSENDDTYKIFGISNTKEVFVSRALKMPIGYENQYVPAFGTELQNENGENVTVCEYFNIECDDEDLKKFYNGATVGTTGVFKNGQISIRIKLPFIGYQTITYTSDFSGDMYIVAVTENNCRAISPVYSLANVYASVVIGPVHTKVIKSSSGGGGGGDEPTPEGGGDDTPENNNENAEQTRSLSRAAGTRAEGDDSGDGGESGGEGGEGEKTETEIKDTNAVGFYVTNAIPMNEGKNIMDELCYEGDDRTFEGLYYFNYFDYELHAICELDPLHVVEDTAIIPAADNKCDKNIMFVNVDDDTYEIIESYIQNEREKNDWSLFDAKQMLRNALSNVTTVELRDVTGLRHIACISADSLDMYKDEWNAISYRPNGGYWYNKAMPDDTSDTSIKTKYLSTNSRKNYGVYSLFGVPCPTAEMKNAGSRFGGWYEIDNEEEIIQYKEFENYECDYEYTEDETSPDWVENKNKEPKIYVAKWITPFIIRWLANESSYGYFDVEGEPTECAMEIEDDATTPKEYACVYGIPKNHMEGFEFAGWECKENCEEVVIDAQSNKVKTAHSCVLMAKWNGPTIVTWQANGGHFETGEEEVEQTLTSTQAEQPQSCPLGIPVKEGFAFEKWECKDNCDGVEINTETHKVTPHHTCTIKAVWKQSKSVRWIEAQKVNVTFNVSRNNGEWYGGSMTDYVKEIDINSTATCNKIAVSKEPSVYGFAGWSTNPSDTSGSNEIPVGTTDLTVYAIFRRKDCQVFLNDLCSTSNKIFLEADTASAASGTHFEYTGVDNTKSHQYMVNGKGNIMLYGVTNSSLLRLYVSDEVFIRLNNNNPFADIYSNSHWNINEINSKLQTYNICYSKPEINENYVTNNGTQIVYGWNGSYDSTKFYLSPKQYNVSDGYTLGSNKTQNNGTIYALWPFIYDKTIEFDCYFANTNVSGVTIKIGNYTFSYSSDSDYTVRNGVAGQVTLGNGGNTIDIKVKVNRLNTIPTNN